MVDFQSELNDSLLKPKLILSNKDWFNISASEQQVCCLSLQVRCRKRWQALHQQQSSTTEQVFNWMQEYKCQNQACMLFLLEFYLKVSWEASHLCRVSLNSPARSVVTREVKQGDYPFECSHNNHWAAWLPDICDTLCCRLWRHSKTLIERLKAHI